LLTLLHETALLARRSLSVSTYGMEHLPGSSVGRSVGQSVSLLVHRVYCGKTADWIWMPFRAVSGVG